MENFGGSWRGSGDVPRADRLMELSHEGMNAAKFSEPMAKNTTDDVKGTFTLTFLRLPFIAGMLEKPTKQFWLQKPTKQFWLQLKRCSALSAFTFLGRLLAYVTVLVFALSLNVFSLNKNNVVQMIA